MAGQNGMKNLLGIIDAAANVLDSTAVKKGVKATGTVAKSIKQAMDTGGAITALTEQTTILSRAFVDESIASETVIPNLMTSIHGWYAAQIISALHISKLVDGTRTIQQVLHPVSSGHQRPVFNITADVLSRFAGQESFLSEYLGTEALSDEDPLVLVTKDQLNDLEEKANRKPSGSSDLKSVNPIEISDGKLGPIGSLYEVKMSNPNGGDDKGSVVIPVYVQVQPSIIPFSIAPRFIDMNVSPSFWRRWTQKKAGEISFWKDFIFKRDLIKRYKSVLKNESAAKAFTDFLKTVARKDVYALSDVSRFPSNEISYNLSNTVMVFSEETVLQAKADSAVDLHNSRDRNRYFRDTYSMILVIIDPMHQRLTIYFNGIDGSMDRSYSDFKPKDTKFDPNDFMNALQAFSTNNLSRMR